MSYPSIPLGVPACAMRDPWQSQPVDPHRRTEMDDGSLAIERKLHRLRTVDAITWELSGLQFELVKRFWADSLDAGSKWFYAPIVEGSSTNLHLARFTSSPPWTATSPAPGVFRLAFELELKDLPRLSLSQAMALEVWLGCPDDIDDFVTRYDALITAWEGAMA